MEKLSNDLKKLKINSLGGFDNLPGGFLIYKADQEEEILFVNDYVLDLFECNNLEEFNELTKKSFKGLVHPDDYEQVSYSIKKQIKSYLYDQVHYRIVTKNGNLKYVEDYGKYVINEEYGPLFYVFISTEKTKIDTLTGLPKMKYFINLAKDAIDEIYSINKVPVMVSFDLVGLKNFNFKYGLDEGDILISKVAQIIRKHFGNMYSSRFGEDDFYAVSSKDIVEENAKKVIEDIKKISDGKTTTIRIGIAECEKGANVELLCNKARTVVDSLKNVNRSIYKWFNEEESYALSLKEYIINHIDEAISKGWIEPYYQPVVRTLSKRLCSMEVLARWIDPVHGLIASNNFVSILEEIGLAYKLDMYIAERAISTLQMRLKQGLPVVPVSINVSRMDFEYIDPVEVISTTCDMHEVRRSLVCIEITESAFISNKDVIKKAIDDFHRAGFEVWMDDFGSGYSSLNVLKDFDFDELKLDMAFIHDFGEKSRNIITLAIKMAKSLGMHTLAEGVETEEQFQFLKSIGCEKIQGYYFGQPKPLPEQLENLRIKGIVYENRELSDLYQNVGKVDLVTNSPIALFFFDGKRYTLIFRNQKFIDLFPNLNIASDKDLNLSMNSAINPLAQKIRSFGNKVLNSGKKEHMTFALNESYYNFSLEPITITSKGAMLLAELSVTLFTELEEYEERDSVIRVLSTIYDCIYLLDFNGDTRTIIQSNIENEIEGEVEKGINNYFKNQKSRIYEFDEARWENFSDPTYIINRTCESNKGYFSDIFLVKNYDGNYIWTEYDVISVSFESRQIILCTKQAPLEDADKKEYVKRITSFTNFSFEEYKTNNDCWNSLVENGNIKFFWKDMNRRFLGASKAFRKYYGFTSDDQFIGKTDEEVGWHLNDSEFESDEYKVLNKGEIISFASTVNVVDGVAHRIIASKFPVYHDAKIIGLVGYFVDSAVDKFVSESSDKRFQDPITGLMNTYGLMVSLFDLEDNFKCNKEDYTFVVIKVKGFEDYLEDYGVEKGNILLCKISKLIKESFDERAVLARTESSTFSICSRGINKEEMYRNLKFFEDKLEKLSYETDERIRLSLSFGIASAIEGDSVQKVAQKAYSRFDLLTNKKSDLLNIENPDPYTDIPLPYIIVRPLYDKIGKLNDIEYIYSNNSYTELTGKKLEEIIGKGYHEVFKNTGDELIDCAYKAIKGSFIKTSIYDGASHHWVEITASPCNIPAACSIIFDVIDQERRVEQSLLITKSTSDEVLNILRILESEEDDVLAANKLLNELGKALDATNILVYATDLNSFNCPYEWHKEGIESRKDLIIDRPYSLLKEWHRYKLDDSNVFYLNKNDLNKDDYLTRIYFEEFKIESLYSIPIKINELLVGYIVCENTNPKIELNIKSMLEQISYFVTARFNLRKLYFTKLDYEYKNDLANKETLASSLANDIGKILINEKNYQKAIYNALDKLGAILHPLRSFVINMLSDSIDNFIEWFNNDNYSIKDYIDEELIRYIKEKINDKVIVIDDISKLKNNEKIYSLLIENNINSLIVAPIIINKKVIGILAITNYYNMQSIDMVKMIESVAFLIGFRMISYKENQFDDNGSNGLEKSILPEAIIKVVLNKDKEYATDFTYEYVNDSYANLVNRQRDELIGHNYYEIFHSVDPQLVFDSYQAAISKKIIKEKKINIFTNKFEETVISPYKDDGYALMIVFDIDNEYKEELERSNENKLNESIIDVCKELNNIVIYEDAINNSLKKLSKYIRAEHIYIILHEGDYFREKFLYSLDGIDDKISSDIKIDKNLLYVSSIFKDKDYYYNEINQIEKGNIEVAKIFRDRGILNVLHVPLYNGEVVIGYLGIQNFDKNHLEKYSKLLSSLSPFFSSKIVLNNQQEEIKDTKESNNTNNQYLLDSVLSTYYGACILDIESNMIEPLNMPEEIKKKIGLYERPFEAVKTIYLDKYVSLEDKKKILDFINLSTLDDRMKFDKSISLNYKDLYRKDRRITITVLMRKDESIKKILIRID